jgi:magnesium transporter
VLGLLIAAIAYIWKNQPVLGLVVGVSVFLNMITAAVAGFLVPWGFQIIRIDPALASPVLVTTLTDTIGYFIYLGIASLLLIQML